MTHALEADESSFGQKVVSADRPVLVEFWARWCPPCHQLAPVLDAIAAERADHLTVVKINSDENPAVAAAYRVMALPTMILFHRGEPVWSVVGARSKARLLHDLDDALATLPVHPTSTPSASPSLSPSSPSR